MLGHSLHYFLLFGGARRQWICHIRGVMGHQLKNGQWTVVQHGLNLHYYIWRLFIVAYVQPNTFLRTDLVSPMSLSQTKRCDWRTSVGSQVDQCSGDGSHGGPCPQMVDDLSCWKVIPLVKRSAGLPVDGQYFHLLETERISATQWHAYGFDVFWLHIQYRKIWLSNHEWTVRLMFRDFIIKWASLAVSTPAFLAMTAASVVLDINIEACSCPCWINATAP